MSLSLEQAQVGFQLPQPRFVLTRIGTKHLNICGPLCHARTSSPDYA
jgi:hypothetical protein